MTHLVDAVALQRLEPARAASTDKISVVSRADVNASSGLEVPQLSGNTLPPTRRLQRVKQSQWLDKRLLACFSCLHVAGWSDASAGPLLPYIQAWYSVNYATVSCIWISQAIGFIIGSCTNIHLISYFGEGTFFALCAALQMCCYAFAVPALPFPVLCVTWVFLGLSMSGQDAVANFYVANLPSAAQKLGILHAMYGAGALITPLTATAMVDAGVRWSYAYAPVLVLAVLNFGLVCYAFRFERQIPHISPAPQLDETTGEEVIQDAMEENPTAQLKRVLKSKVTLLFASFLLVYVGTEVSEGGWMVSYLVDERHGGTRAGYVASGFWAGLTLGRIVLPQFNVRVGEWRAIVILIVLAIAVEALIYAIRDFYASAVFYGITGFLIGPFYPTAISLATKLLPRSLHTGALGFCASFGQAGSAVFPFITGALAQKLTTNVLQPMLMVLLACQLGIWLFVPRPKRARE